MSRRTEKMSSLVQIELGELIVKKLKDPRIGFVSITEVDVSPDLTTAKVFVSILGDPESQKKTMDGLTAATRFVRFEIGRRMELRSVPEIRFIQDKSLERGARILTKMKELAKSSNTRGGKVLPQPTREPKGARKR